MTGRERLVNLLRRRPFEGLSWSALVDGNTLSALSGELVGCSPVEFYRALGCDIFQWGGSGFDLAVSPAKFSAPEDFSARRWAEGESSFYELTCPRGTLRSETRAGHPVKPLVSDADEIALYRDYWEAVTVEPVDVSTNVRRIEETVGEDGVFSYTCSPSAIPTLLEQIMGIEGFYYLLTDHREEMEGLFLAIHRVHREFFRLLAESPGDCAVLVENTSTRYISPDVYRTWNLPHQREFCEVMQAAGKTAILHMCGHVHRLLEDIRETGCDGIHALTPPPVGDTPWEDALDVLGEDFVVMGCLDPSLWLSAAPDAVADALDAFYTPRLRRANFVLLTFADGIIVPIERFRAVADWFERNGK